MTTVLNLHRSSYVDPSSVPQTLDYLSARYLNIKFIVPARNSFTVTQAYEANAPGIAFDFYGSADYWWVILLFNGIVEPLEELVAGRVLQLPGLADINAFLSLKESQNQDLTVTL
jgi:hypothetical protein